MMHHLQLMLKIIIMNLCFDQISKEDSVERSLQQAKLQRQDKTQQQSAEDLTSDQQSASTSDTNPLVPSETNPTSMKTSPSMNITPSPPSEKSKSREPLEGNMDEMDSRPKFPPIETNLDDMESLGYPDSLDHSDQTSDTIALLRKTDMPEKCPSHLATQEPSSIMSSDDEATLLEEN